MDKNDGLERLKPKILTPEVVDSIEAGFPPPPPPVTPEVLERSRMELKTKLLETNHALTEAMSAFQTIRNAKFESGEGRDYRKTEMDTLEAIHQALSEVIIEFSKNKP